MNAIKKKSSSKRPRMPTTDVCTYKLMKNEFAKSMKPPIKLYNILGKKQKQHK